MPSLHFSRLPTAVKPTKYTVDYDVIDLDRFRFEGNERIDIAIVEATSTITCHAVELWVHSVSLTTQDGKTIACAEIRHVDKDESVTFVFPETLAAGTTAVLSLRFHGILNDKLKGFYRSQYTQDGESRTMAVTQFEACDARRALVCWDEPAIKAKFQISMVTRPDREAISNTPVVSTCVRTSKSNPNIQEKHWQFAETPIMSTYLLAMVVGEFDFVSDYTKEGVLVRVYTPVGHSERGRFALRVGTECLSFFTAKFGIPYPLAKLDMLAIPDFAAGAMENWGVVTYRERVLLVDEATSSYSQRLMAGHVVCHELAHQWFGNLVTMEWWTELWLNEGFARFMEHEAMHAIFPTWNIWGNFIQDPLAIQKDSMVSSHPIEVVVHHPHEIDQVFDVIAYRKGAAVIRMLASFVGSDKFYIGMHNYLTQYAYGNAKTVDLWSALEAASGLKMTAMAHTWTTQTGLPVVTVSKARDGRLELTQRRFFSDGLEHKDSTAWDIPLTYVTEAGVVHAGIWKAPEHSTFYLDVPTHAEWIKLNAAQQGFYLVNYSSELWHALKAPVASKALDVVDRVALLQTSFVLARAGHLGIGDVLNFAQAYAHDTEFLVWKELSANLVKYADLFDDEAWFPEFQQYLRKLYAPIMKQLTWTKSPSDDDLTSELRSQVIAMLGLAKDPDVVAEASARFLAAASRTEPLPADLRTVIYRIHIANTKAPEDAFEYLTTLHDRTDAAEIKLECINTLGQFPQKALKKRAIEWGLQNVRSQDISSVFSGVASSSAGSKLAWSYIQENWDALNAKYSEPRLFGRILTFSLRKFHDHLDDIETFLEPRRKPGYERSLNEALEAIRTKSVIYKRDGAALQALLSAP
ncbi:unnamed protein product [Aphanomyces euteiches]|uniref:Aminopeptidase n=1 Tax=Aphanomyces euteiches TaxID=100861 RepID=A0A6G0WLU5_9STRA|nr:hypothetical protein Ae201684_013846 [Aphanomyces euteiches]KAH9080810.1 hypothetical protein Ae201684P_007899 [Aphanomyces euteiches]